MVWLCIKDISSRLPGRLDCPGKFKDAVIRQKHIHLISTPTLNQEAIANFMEKADMRIIYAGCAMNYIPTVFIWHNLLPTISPKTLKS